MTLLEGAIVRPCGEAAVVVEFGTTIDVDTNRRVLALDDAVCAHPPAGVLETVPTYRSLLVRLDPAVTGPDEVAAALRRLERVSATERATLHEIPVVLGGDKGPDLADVASAAGIDVAACRAALLGRSLRVFHLGFAPGFAYLGGLPAVLDVPRRRTPRAPVPAGSLLVAAGQAAVCPVSMPTGWWVVGRTEAVLWDVDRDPPSLLVPGDEVVFVDAG